MSKLRKLPNPNEVLGEKKLPTPQDVFNQPEEKPFDIFQQPNINTETTGRDKIKEWVDKDPLLQDNFLGMGGNRAGTLKKLIDNGGTPEQIKNSYLTLTKKHPHQEGFGSYYINENGEAIPLKSSERPPSGYDVASVWGNKNQADNDSWYTTIVKKIYNIIPGVIENVADVVQLPNVIAQKAQTNYGIEDLLGTPFHKELPTEETKIKEADWYKTVKNDVNSLKMINSEKSKEPMLNTENIKKISDIAKADNWKFTVDNIAGTVGGLAQSVGEFIVGGEITKPLALAEESVLAGKVVNELSKSGVKKNLFAASYMTQFGDVLDAAKNAGLNTEDAYTFASTISAPLALVDMGLGVEGKIFKDQVANAEKKNLIKGIVDGFVKDTDGKITKEALDDAFNVTTVANTSLAKTWLKETGKASLGEGGQEALQSFIQKAGEQIHDKLSTGDDKKFGTDALSAQSFAQYLQEGIAGALGGAPTALAYDKIKAINRDENQSKSAFELVKNGETAINAFKQNLEKQFADGNITKEQKENALLKVESYNDYNRLITNKNLNIDDTKKRELFDKTFQKENLESQIKSMGNIGKLNPIDLGEFKGLEKQAHDLQKDINEIIFSSQIKNETTVGNKTIDDIVKSEEKSKETKNKTKISNETKLLIDKYKKPEKVEDKRTFEETPTEDFNKRTNDARNTFNKVVNHLSLKLNEYIYGKLTENPFVYKKANETYAFEFPSEKKLSFASSMTRNFEGGSGGFKGHFREEHFSDIKKEDLKGHPLAMKLVEIPAVGEKTRNGKEVQPIKAIKIVRADNGKFLGWGKATNTGSIDVSEEQAKLLEDEQFNNDLPINKDITNPINTTPTNEQTTITEGTTKGEISKTNGNGIDQSQKVKSEKGNLDLAHHENVLKVTKRIQEVLPKIKVIYNPKLKAAGVLRAGGKQIEINPYYANIDTPIHEAGHVLIDAIGYNNKVIQAAINQLKGTKLYSETKERYPELSEEMLNKEVLAEAIGREGADIFEKEADKSKFKQYLDYIFNWLKTKLGINKNIAKSLAKQIIGGIGTKNITGTQNKEEQLQKEKETEQSFDDYRKEELERDIIQQQKDLQTIEKYLADENLSDEDIESLEETKEAILDQIKEDKAEFDLYTMGIAKAEEILTAKDLEKYSVDELIEGYNTAIKMKDSRKRADIMKRIAFYFNESRRQELRKFDEFIDKEANKADLGYLSVWTRVLSHMTENFPELQKLNTMFDKAYQNKVAESNKMKKELEKKAKAVIKETNKKLGIGERVLHLFHSNNAKYFEYMDENGKFRENTSGLTDAQKDLLNHMKGLLALREKQYDEHGEEITQDQILKIDKSFAEEFKTEGLMHALSNYFGGSNLADVEIKFTNPLTHRNETVPYLDAQKSILDKYKGNFNIAGKNIYINPLGLSKLLEIAYKAKKNSYNVVVGKDGKVIKRSQSDYSFNFNGNLTNKFDRPRNKDVGYSKDFYKAALNFIDDYTHVKHMNDLVPVVNSLDYLYSRGYGDILAKPNAKKWLEEWSQMQIYRTDKVTDPLLDHSLKFVRTLTSQIVMGFNISAAVMNIFMGNYNNWRVSTGKLGDTALGNRRLFLNPKKSYDLINKFDVVKADSTSNPKFGVGQIFQKLAFGAQSLGELQIQGSMFLRQLNEDEWNSFEYNDKGELDFKKDITKEQREKIEEKFEQYKNKVSDIQGKYSEKDHINFLRSEWGKTIGQFKVWMPTALKERFGAKYIDYKGEVKQGTFNGLIADGFKEIREDIKRDGIKGFWNNKNARANLKGLMAITFFAILAHQDDEDESVRKKALSANNALGNLLFVFDINQMKYMAKNPVASLGTLQKFLDVSEALLDMDSKKLKKTTPKIVPYGKAYTQIEKIFEEE